ncbi:bifunctional hydroxymethylpyrimidine kinase/phosphomethylpyrimidine kinase [Pseudohongiella spirulinae]|uniref:hydroxymethylpyrimidine kinase n=1 Tax=Pseudohongiella spirulinae TaxID=1249552 RepID=A0A0S2KFL8_9GAMM|nr:hydroxymethylpyrimidine/phosphomethylpyrimidine kinase [Pseudohongiella spirulinae]ALO47126.1 Hydroxymethylpyrimidine/phosphomethylpyrimidine kinase [Pseudohongiella spirulinae]
MTAATTQTACVLCLSGLDPSGGAGIQADIEAISAMGAHALPVVTTLTVQNSVNVIATQPVDGNLIRQQVSTLVADFQIQAIKIGLIDSPETLKVVAQILADMPDIPVIADPVLKAGGGFDFDTADLLTLYRKLIIPATWVLTPNTDELRRLVPDSASQESAANELLSAGCEFVLVTGTHDNTESVINRLYAQDARIPAQQWSWPRLTGSYHGSGCTLASALAACIAKGLSISDSAQQAQNFTWHALNNGFRPGSGQHFPNRRPASGTVDMPLLE